MSSESFNKLTEENRLTTICPEVTENGRKEKEARKRFFEWVDKIHNKTREIPLQEVEDIINEAIEESRKSQIKTPL